MPCSDLGLADGNISNLDQACPFPPHPLFFPFSKKCTTRKGQGSMFSPNKPLLPSTGKKRQSTFNNKKGAKYNEVQYFSIPLQNFFFFLIQVSILANDLLPSWPYLSLLILPQIVELELLSLHHLQGTAALCLSSEIEQEGQNFTSPKHSPLVEGLALPLEAVQVWEAQKLETDSLPLYWGFHFLKTSHSLFFLHL